MTESDEPRERAPDGAPGSGAAARDAPAARVTGTAQSARVTHGLRRLALRALLVVLVFALTLVVVEGVSSLLLVYQEFRLWNREVLAERKHTAYDELLGWVNVPDTRIEDMYGPGRPLTINAQGFRNRGAVAPEVPAGRVRVVCSGDSFTLGFGVGDDDTWVSQLAALEPRFEPVNMGQGGYGVDQAFLWYRRDAAELDHDVQVFAFITGDFRRMQKDTFNGYPKPVLKVVDGELTVENVPVPRTAYWFPWFTQNQRKFEKLKAVELVRRLRGENPDQPKVQLALGDRQVRRVVLSMFEELARLNRERGSALVCVHLPMKSDHEPAAATDEWRAFLARELAERGIAYADLVAPFRRLPAERVDALFIAEDAIDLPGAAGHYTEAGNRHFAERVHAELVRVPAIASRLADD